MDPFRLCLSVLTSCCSSGSPGSFPVSLKINGWHSCRPYNLIPHYPEKAFWEIVEERGGFSFPECMQAQLSQSSPTICDPMDCSLQGFFVHEILQIRILEWVAMPSSRGSSHPGIKSGSPALQADSLPSEPPGKPYVESRTWYNDLICKAETETQMERTNMWTSRG